jgi:type IV secretion system protein VirD4
MASMSDAQGSPSSLSPLENVLLVGLAVAGGVAVAVWSGAALSSALAGHGPPPVGLGDSLRAIPGLIESPATPALAWPQAARSTIATAPLYWSATGLTAVLVIGAVLSAWRLWRGLTPHRRRLGVDAHARFATRRELRPLLLRRPVPGRFVFGAWGRWLLATENRRWAPAPSGPLSRGWGRLSGRVRAGQEGDVTSLAICGPTRCGKTSQCAEPGLLDWRGPAIVLSVKRDLMDTTIARRRALGQVRVFDPGGFLAASQSHITVGSGEIAKWSPLRTAHTASGAKKAGEALSAWTPKSGVEGGMDFWSTQGKLLFTGLLGTAALAPRPSMHDVATWVFNMTMPDSNDPEAPCEPVDILDLAVENPDTEDAADAAIQHLFAIWNKPDPKIVASVYATAQTVCDPWLDPNVVAATDLHGDGEWVDLDWLMDTGPDGDRANTLYLLVSLDDYKRLAPVLAGLLSDLKSQAYEWEMTGRRLPAPLLMLIDEAGNMPLDWLPEVSSTCAGIGIQLVTIWQSFAQIHEAYGKRADTLLTNHATKLFFPGSSDDSTLGYVSKIVGDEQVERRSWSNDIGGGNGRRSVSGQANAEALVPYFLSRLPRYGSALMIHSNLPPAHVQGRPWWKIRRLAAMVPAAPAPSKASCKGPWAPTPERRRTRPPGAPPRPDTPVEADTAEPPIEQEVA